MDPCNALAFQSQQFVFLGEKRKYATVNKMIWFIDIKVSTIIIEFIIIVHDKQGNS